MNRCTLIFACLCLPILALATSSPSNEAIAKHAANTQDPAEKNFALGVEQYKKHDLNSAIDSFLQSVYFARNGYYPDAYFWLGKAYMAKHEDSKAEGAFKKQMEQSLNPSPDSRLFLAEIYLRNDRDAESEEECKLALATSGPTAAIAHNVYGKIMAKRGDYMDAQLQFQEALGRTPPWTYTEAWMNYAETFMLQKDWSTAYTQYLAMLANPIKLLNLDLQQVHLNMGLCLLAKGDHQGAIDNFHQVLEYNPQNSIAHLQLGMIFEAEKHISSAIDEYSDYVRYSTDQIGVTKAKERITVLEQLLKTPNEPAHTQPSPYMRYQQQQRQQDDQQLEQQRQLQQQQISVPKESGF